MGAVQTAGCSKRIDTKVSILLGLQFPLFVGLTHTRDRRPLRNWGTAEDFFFRLFRNLFAVSDSVLLHIWFTLRRRDITVLRNSFVWWPRTAPTDYNPLISFNIISVGRGALTPPCNSSAYFLTVGAAIGRPRNVKCWLLSTLFLFLKTQKGPETGPFLCMRKALT